MCGIVGWISKNHQVEPSFCRKALESLKHRGPDCQRGLFFGSSSTTLENLGEIKTSSKCHAFLGHTRLSIIDLDPASHQPFSVDKRYWLVYNGEIYNFPEIRIELERLGYKFLTDSDTEVALNSFIEFGPKAIDRFNGMWSLAFFDSVNRQLLLSRDRYGKKPLFYSKSEQDFVFGSEFKAIFSIQGESKRRMVPEFARDFVEKGEWGKIDGESTCYEGVSAVEPGTVFCLSLDSLSFTKVHCSRNNYATGITQAPLEQALPDLIANSVSLRLRADVPVGVLISGGVDSSIVAGYLNDAGGENVTWFAGNTGHGNDVHYSKIMADTFKHPLEIIDVFPDENILEVMREMSQQYEVPVWLLGNSIGVYLMYRAMHTRGIKVVLDGTGGDEVFGGYYNFYAESVIDDCVSRRGFIEAARFIWNCKKHKHFSARKLLSRFRAGWKLRAKLSKSPLADCQIRDIENGHLPSWLYMNDQNSMAHSMEARSPLLDSRLAKYVSLDADRKFHKGFNKHALRRAMPACVPSSVRWRRDKQGFRWLPNDIIKTHFKEMKDVIGQSKFVREIFHDFSFPETANDVTDAGGFLRLYAVALLDSVNSTRIDRSNKETTMEPA